jgi:5-methylcytosine-specific restriction endonuclease McrA
MRNRRKGNMKQYRSWEASLRKKEALARRIERKQQRRDELSPATRRKVWTRFGRVCYLCGRSGADTIDHVIPLNKGGTNEFKNLRPAHEECNRNKGDKVLVLPEELESVGW